jgi:hypothetical protein
MTRAAAQAEQLRPEVSEDSLLGGRVRLLQPAEGWSGWSLMAIGWTWPALTPD